MKALRIIVFFLLPLARFSLPAVSALLLVASVVQSSAQAISNGGFETDLVSWSATGGFAAFTNSTKANSGNKYAFTGVTSDLQTPSEGTLSQLITIPSNASSAKLQFFLWVASDEDTSGDWDVLKVQILSPTGTLLRYELGSYSNKQKSGPLNSGVRSYTQYHLDLSDYIGQSIKIQFRSFPDSSINTIFRLDDISLITSSIPPSIQTNQPVDIKSNSATLNGWGNPNGLATTVYFQYGTTTNYGNQTSALTNQTSAVYFQSALTNLIPNTTYHCRAVATNTGGTSYGNNAAFTTKSVERPNLVLNQPNGWPQRVLLSTAPGNTTTHKTTLGSDEIVYLSIAPANTGLAPSSTFHIEIKVDNFVAKTIGQPNGLVVGQESQFTGIDIGTLSVGQHTIIVKVDSDNIITEDSEGDNAFDFTIDVTGPSGPAVNITSPGANSSWSTGSNMPITWTMSGQTAGVSGFLVSIKQNGTTFFSQRFPLTTRSVDFTIPSYFTTDAGTVTVEPIGVPGHAANVPFSTTGTVANNSLYPVIRIAGVTSANPQLRLNIPISFLGDGIGNITGWFWEFSDGTTSNLKNPIHVFSTGYGKDGNWARLTISGPSAASQQASVRFALTGTSADTSISKSGERLDPVNSATGSFIIGLTPMTLQARGLPFSFQCYYNSQSYRPECLANPEMPESSPGSLGHGWTHGFETSLISGREDSIRYVLILFGDGHAEKYIQQPDGTWLPQPGVYSTLTEGNDGRFALTTMAGIRHQFDSSGRLQSINDRNSNTLLLVWELLPGSTETENKKRIAYIILPGGPADGSATHKVLFHYRQGSPSFLWKLEDEMHHFVEFRQDAKYDLIAVTNQMGHTTSYTYDDLHQILTEKNARGFRVVENNYDQATRRVIRQTDASDTVALLDYNFPGDSTSNRITTITRLATPTNAATDPTNEVTTDIHNSKLQLVERKVRLQSSPEVLLSERYQYDEVTGDLISSWNRRGYRTQFTTVAGHVTSVTAPDSGTTTYAYEDALNPHLPTLIKYPDNRVKKRITYDNRGNILTTTFPYDSAQPDQYQRAVLPDAFGQVTSATDANGNTILFFYDEWGRRWKTTNAELHDSFVEFDVVGRAIATIDERGTRTNIVLNAVGNVTETRQSNPDDPANPLITTILYDENEQPVLATDPLGHANRFYRDEQDRIWKSENHEHYLTFHRFDAFGREIETENAKGGISRLIYNFAGYLTKITYPAPSINSVSFLTDASGDVMQTVDGDGVKITAEFDAMDRQIVSRRWKSATEFDETRTSYNLMGQKEWDEDPLHRKTYYHYDLAGNHVSTIPPSGSEFSFTFDFEGHQLTAIHDGDRTRFDAYTKSYQLKERTDENGFTETFRYDSVGNLLSHTNADSQTATYVHDSLNRLTQINPPTGLPITYSYDSAGRRIRMTDATGITKWTYTALNQPTSIEQPSGLFLGFHYDSLGATDSITYPGNRTVTYLTDKAGRFISVTDWQGRTITQSYTPGDRTLGLVFPNGIHSAYDWDGQGRVTSIAHRKDTSPPLVKLDYQFNARGQLSNVPDFPISTADAPYPRTYGKANELLTIDNSPVRHDHRGNLTSAKLNPQSSATDTLTWDYSNRLVSGSVGGAGFANTFNGLADRVSTIRSGTTTNFLLDDRGSLPRILAETDASGSPTAFYLYAGSTLLARILPDDTSAWYHADYQGNVVLMTDSGGSTAALYQYDPFGVLASSSGSLSSTNHFRYLGALGVYDNGDGTLDARARTYHPRLGRFLSRDELFGSNQHGQSLNRYMYGFNSPYEFSDPTGFSAKSSISSYIYNIKDSARSITLSSLPVEQQRKILMLSDSQSNIYIRPNLSSVYEAPFYAIPPAGLISVIKYDREIENASRISDVDPNLLRAIIYIEESQGWYDPSNIGHSEWAKSVLPMNINVDYWGDAFGSKSDLMDSESNIVSGAKFIARLKNISPSSGIAEIATLYNDLGATHVSNYGARVNYLYQTKPWR